MPSVGHFRVFGAIYYRHIPDQIGRKLDDTGEQLILVGYHSTGGYRLFDPKNNQIVISRDVVVDQSRSWNWEAETEPRPTRMLLDCDSTGRVREEDPVPAENEVRRSERVRQLPSRLQDYDMESDSAVNADGDLVHFALFCETELVSVDEAMEDPKWIGAMEEELKSIDRNQTWELVDLPSHKHPIGVKWEYKVKVKGEVAKYKARLVARGFFKRKVSIIVRFLLL